MTDLPTPAVLKELIHYNPDTGAITWKVRDKKWFKDSQQWCADSWNTRYAGKVAGSLIHKHSGKAYIQLNLFDTWFLSHHLISIYMTGAVHTLDHINGDGTDNRWANLRAVTLSENSRNARKSTRNTSGAVGVSWHADRKKWYVSISTDDGRKFIGRFDDFDEAVAARKRAEVEHNYHPNHGKERPL